MSNLTLALWQLGLSFIGIAVLWYMLTEWYDEYLIQHYERSGWRKSHGLGMSSKASDRFMDLSITIGLTLLGYATVYAAWYSRNDTDGFAFDLLTQISQRQYFLIGLSVFIILLIGYGTVRSVCLYCQWRKAHQRFLNTC